MSGIVQVEENNLLNGWLGIAAYTAATTPMKLALATATGTATTAGTEVTGGSYARQTITFNAPSAGATANASAISFTNMPAVTVTGIDIYDSAGTPIRRAFAALTASKTTGAGDTLSFAAGAITASLS
jgi:hypothetical protein